MVHTSALKNPVVEPRRIISAQVKLKASYVRIPKLSVTVIALRTFKGPEFDFSDTFDHIMVVSFHRSLLTAVMHLAYGISIERINC